MQISPCARMLTHVARPRFGPSRVAPMSLFCAARLASSTAPVTPHTPAPFLKSTGTPTTPTTATTAAPPHVLHTGYTTSASALSYAVVDPTAFEAAIAEAAHATVAEAVVPSSPSTSPHHVAAPTTSERTAVLAHTALSRDLLAAYKRDKCRLDVLLEKKAPIDRYVDSLYYPALKYGCFTLLALQLGLYFNWIFFVFDWNLMEPTTYFLAYTGVFASLVYHYVRCGHNEFTWKNFFVYLANKERLAMCEKAKIDAVELGNLKLRVKALEEEISRYEVKD